MARPSSQTPAPAPKVKTSNFIPKATDPRAELFWLLGSIIPAVGIEVVNRITELTIDLTAPAAANGE